MSYILQLVEVKESKAIDKISLIDGTDGFYLMENGVQISPPPSIWTKIGEDSYRNDGSKLGDHKYDNRQASIYLYSKCTGKGDLINKLRRLQDMLAKASEYQKARRNHLASYEGYELADSIELRYSIEDFFADDDDTIFGRGHTRYRIIEGEIILPSELHSPLLIADQIENIELRLTLEPFAYGKICPIGLGSNAAGTLWDIDASLDLDNAISFYTSEMERCQIPSARLWKTTAGTISLIWIPEDDYSYANDRYLLSEAGSPSFRLQYRASDDKFLFSDGAHDVASSAQTFSAGTTFRLTIRWETGKINLTIDKTHYTNNNYTAPTLGTYTSVGGTATSNQCSRGHIQDLRAWGRRLSDSEVETLYDNGIGRTILPFIDKETITNTDDADQDNYFNIAGAPGDVKADLVLPLKTGVAGIQKFYISKYTRYDTDLFKCVWEAENSYLRVGWTDVVDNTCSGDKYCKIYPAEGAEIDWTYATNLSSQDGRFKIFARIKDNSDAAGDIELQIKYGKGWMISLDWIPSTTLAKWYILELGEIEYPALPIIWNLARQDINIALAVKGSTDKYIYVDCLYLMPKEVYGLWQLGGSTTLAQYYHLTFDSINYEQMHNVSLNNKPYDWIGQWQGADLRLKKREPNKFIILMARSSTDTDIHIIADTLTIDRAYLSLIPLYLGVE